MRWMSSFLIVVSASSLLAQEPSTDWPCWRGPKADGIADGRKLPIHWSKTENVRWSVTLPGWGTSSPVVYGEKIFVTTHLKDKKALLTLCFDRATGKELWKVSDDGPSYSTPVAADIGGKRRFVFFTRQGLLVLDPKTGEIVHQMRYRARIDASVNAATPLVADGKIFLSACYGVGALLIDTEGWKPIWKNDESMSSHYTTSVKVGENLYGSHGRQEEGASLRCVAWKTGEVKWTKEGFGCAWLIAADGMLIAAQESGEIALLEASPEGYREKGRFTAFAKSTDRGKLLRSAPALADGVLYVRDAQKLAAWRVGK